MTSQLYVLFSQRDVVSMLVGLFSVPGPVYMDWTPAAARDLELGLILSSVNAELLVHMPYCIAAASS